MTPAEQAASDTLADVKEALALLRRAQDRIGKFQRLPVSVYAAKALALATAEVSEVVYILTPSESISEGN